MRQGDLAVDEYFNQFSRLQEVCELDERETHDLNSFITSLRPNILEDMNDCKTIYEVYWEAIRVSTCLNNHAYERQRLMEESHHKQ